MIFFIFSKLVRNIRERGTCVIGKYLLTLLSDRNSVYNLYAVGLGPTFGFELQVCEVAADDENMANFNYPLVVLSDFEEGFD